MKNVGSEATLQNAVDRLNAVRREIAKIIVGQDDVVEGVLICLLSGGHVLLEGVPGLGKTTLLRTLARTLSLKYGCGEVRGQGLLLALDLQRDIAAAVVELARERGLLINGPCPDALRFMPALTVTDGEIDGMIAILDTVLRDVAAAGGPPG